MSVFIQLLFRLVVAALVGTAFGQFSQIGFNAGSCSGIRTDLDFLGVATA